MAPAVSGVTVDGSPIPAPAEAAYPVRAGNRVRPLIDAVPAFRRICEAVEQARHSVWVTVAFLSPAFRMPGDQGTIFDVLDRAVARGLDVRLLAWRSEPETQGYGKEFPGSEADRALLAARGSRFRIRWDRAHPGTFHHQKSWLVDAGEATETAFVGGINLTATVPHVPGHAGPGQVHDAYVEIAGPAATDVRHTFVQRWNGASERARADGTWPPGDDGGDLPFPDALSPARGTSRVQIQRTVHPGRYDDATPAPGGTPFAVAQGEQSILAQYLLAIDGARSTIQIENQALPVPIVAARLEAALRRGVEVALVLPGEPEEGVRAVRRTGTHRDLFDGLAALGRHDGFVLAGLASGDGCSRHEVYVHDKVMIVDDAWVTIGSCNLHASSLYRNTEMNASIWDAEVAQELRCALLAEHLAVDTGHMDARAAMALFREVATANARCREAGDSAWQGLAHRMDPATYGDAGPPQER